MMKEAETQYQTLINSNTIKSILERLGYNLIDCGNYWRSRAVYRNGDNPTAIQIYKNTGVWIDYIHGNNKSRSFHSLIKLSLKDNHSEIKKIFKNLSQEEYIEETPKQLIEMQKIYPESSLDKLFPNYNFYKDRKISEATQKFFKVGLAGAGQMYRRMVFPIYNEHSQIIGFSGRRVDENDFAKWKHIGRKKNWIYPSYIPSEKTIDSIIDDMKYVFIVESIGDAMALYEQGIKNVVVIFGTTISNDLINYLCSKDLKKIYISTNNDFDSSRNNGLVAAFQAYVKLSGFFNLDQLEIKLPPQNYNDFGKAHEEGYNLRDWRLRKIDTQDQRNYIFKYVKNHQTLFPQDKVKKFLKLLQIDE